VADVPPGSDVRARLRRGEVVRLDGGLGTTLEEGGADVASPLWSARLIVDEPDVLVAAHRAFVAAGAEVVLTASYQLAAESLRRAGRDGGDEAALLARSVELARVAADGRAAVAGSLGPWGALIGGGAEYVGRYGLDVDALVRVHAPRVEALLAAGADALAFETVPAAVELAAIARVVGGVEVPVWVSVTTSPSDPTRTPEGDPLLAAFAPVLERPEVVAVGVNCVPPRHVGPALDVLAGSGRPLVVQPNTGGTYRAGTGWLPEGDAGTPDPPGWVAAGARLVGGCCGTSPSRLAALFGALGPELASSPDGAPNGDQGAVGRRPTTAP
jgi:homocysteine S-methyltransferase